MNREEEKAMDQEVESMLTKGAIREAIPKTDQFLSNVFVRPKGDGRYRPRKGDWMVKLDLKDAYFSVPVSTWSRKLIRFHWKGILYEYLCLAFGLGPTPRIFTKLMKVLVSVLRKLGIRLVI